jgi:hypothetical protein
VGLCGAVVILVIVVIGVICIILVRKHWRHKRNEEVAESLNTLESANPNQSFESSLSDAEVRRAFDNDDEIDLRVDLGYVIHENPAWPSSADADLDSFVW